MNLNSFEFIDAKDWCRPASNREDLLNNSRTWLELFSDEYLEISRSKYATLSKSDDDIFFDSVSDITSYSLKDFQKPEKIGGSILVNLNQVLIKDSSLLVLVRNNLSLTEGYGSRRWADFQLNTWPLSHNFPLCKINVENLQSNLLGRLKIYLLDEVEYLSTPVLYMSVRSDDANFYHWLIETVVRIRALDEIPELAEIPMVFRNELSDLQLEILNLLGIKNQVFVTNGRSFVAEKLFYPSIPSPPCFHREAMNWLRLKVLNNMPSIHDTKRRKIYISREDGVNRKVLNELEVIRALEAKGIECIVMTKLCFIDQINLIRSAKLIVFPHGAAGTHLVYAPMDCVVIEIHSPYHVHNCFLALCNSIGIKYKWLLGEKRMIEDEKNNSIKDYFVNVKKIESLLE